MLGNRDAVHDTMLRTTALLSSTSVCDIAIWSMLVSVSASNGQVEVVQCAFEKVPIDFGLA